MAKSPVVVVPESVPNPSKKVAFTKRPNYAPVIHQRMNILQSFVKFMPQDAVNSNYDKSHNEKNTSKFHLLVLRVVIAVGPAPAKPIGIT